MTVLVIAEHDNAKLKTATLNAVTAAKKLGDVEILVAGQGCAAVATEAAKIPDVKKVLLADDSAYKNFLAENLAALVAKLGANYAYVLAPSTTTGKNTLPRAAALLDVQMISDVCGVVNADTFVRPIYAGNAFATVQTKDKIKVMTIRLTAFDAAPATGGSATVENTTSAGDTGLTSFVSQQITKSARPELTSAKIIVSGGRGMGNGDNFKLIDALADKLGAAVLAAAV